MAVLHGLWPGVVAIAADADMFCVSCAEQQYGSEGIRAVIDGVVGYENYVDHEGNPLGVVLNGSEDVHTMYCGGCGERLCKEGCSCYRYPDEWEQHGALVCDGDSDWECEEDEGGYGIAKWT